MISTVIDEIRDETFDLWVGYDDKLSEYLVEACAKVPGGIRHLVNRYGQLDVERYMNDVLEYGHFSVRPYKPGQSCDGSITQCALALFVSWCKGVGLNPEELHRRAYPDEEPPDFAEVSATANWEGVDYPVKWTAKSKSAMLDSLTEINYHSLRSVVEEVINMPVITPRQTV